MARTSSLVLALMLLGSPAGALASEEEIHPWKSVALVATAASFGDVEVTASVTSKLHVGALAVKVKGASIVVPVKWLQSLPPLVLAGLQVRSERGYDPTPILYVVLRTTRAGTTGVTDEHVHIWFQDGKLARATITTVDAKGQRKTTERAAP